MSEMNARHIYTALKSSQVVQKIQQLYIEGTLTKETYELLFMLSKDVENLLINIDDDAMFDFIVKRQAASQPYHPAPQTDSARDELARQLRNEREPDEQ